MLRSGALSDARVIKLIDEAVVPVWINVRTTPLPRRGWVDRVLVNAKLDGENRVVDAFSQGFFVRSAVLTPDGDILLNPAPATVASSVDRFVVDGAFSYAEVDPGDYLQMLGRALERFRATRERN